jgi:tellurite resistance protein TehA-like permease
MSSTETELLRPVAEAKRHAPTATPAHVSRSRILAMVGLAVVGVAAAALWKLVFDYLADSYILLVLAGAAAAVTVTAVVASRFRSLHPALSVQAFL